MHQDIQYGGFVKDKETGKYICLFTTIFSELLAEKRAKERAASDNRHLSKQYDLKDIIVRRRQVTYGEWM